MNPLLLFSILVITRLLFYLSKKKTKKEKSQVLIVKEASFIAEGRPACLVYVFFTGNNKPNNVISIAIKSKL